MDTNSTGYKVGVTAAGLGAIYLIWKFGPHTWGQGQDYSERHAFRKTSLGSWGDHVRSQRDLVRQIEREIFGVLGVGHFHPRNDLFGLQVDYEDEGWVRVSNEYQSLRGSPTAILRFVQQMRSVPSRSGEDFFLQVKDTLRSLKKSGGSIAVTRTGVELDGISVLAAIPLDPDQQSRAWWAVRQGSKERLYDLEEERELMRGAQYNRANWTVMPEGTKPRKGSRALGRRILGLAGVDKAPTPAEIQTRLNRLLFQPGSGGEAAHSARRAATASLQSYKIKKSRGDKEGAAEMLANARRHLSVAEGMDQG